jgi:hypothetical protein
MTDHYTIKLRGPADLERVNKMAVWAAGQVGKGWTIIATRKRSVEQNARMWALIERVAKAHPVYQGVQMDKDDWKAVFVHALMGSTRLVPGLDGRGLVALSHRTSKLSVEQMSDLMALIEAWCASNNVDTGET